MIQVLDNKQGRQKINCYVLVPGKRNELQSVHTKFQKIKQVIVLVESFLEKETSPQLQLG